AALHRNALSERGDAREHYRDVQAVDAALRCCRPHARIGNRAVADDCRVEKTGVRALRKAARDVRIAGLRSLGLRTEIVIRRAAWVGLMRRLAIARCPLPSAGAPARRSRRQGKLSLMLLFSAWLSSHCSSRTALST